MLEGVARVAYAFKRVCARGGVGRETIEHEIQRILDSAPPAMREAFRQIFDKECSHDM